MIVVIDYKMGNMRSIEKALAKLNAEFKISNKKEDIEAATHIILPGVGFFEEGMNNLRKLNLIEPLKKAAADGKFFLGICLGMQLLFKTSEEALNMPAQGLGLLNGHVKKFNTTNLKIPHVGWNEVFGDNMSDIPLFKGVEAHTNFYFVHSYHAELSEDMPHTYTDYGFNFVSAVQKENICGTQFHPEKSQKKGLQVLKNFIELGGKDAEN